MKKILFLLFIGTFLSINSKAQYVEVRNDIGALQDRLSFDACVGEIFDYIFVPEAGETFVRWSGISALEADGKLEILSSTPSRSVTIRWLIPQDYAELVAVYDYGAGSSSVRSPSATVHSFSNVTVNISIIEGDIHIIPGEELTFGSNITGGGTNPTYNWKINGSTVYSGSGTPYETFTTSDLIPGDEISLSIIPDFACYSPSNPKSDPIVMRFVGEGGLNAILSRTFDQDGTTIVNATKNYFDYRGKLLQSQSRVLIGRSSYSIYVNQPIYDRYDRPVMQTMTGILPTGIFSYAKSFAMNTSGNPFSYKDINDYYHGENPDPTGAEPMSDNLYSLGWYYSDNNTIDSYNATTQYPYSLTQYYDDGSGEVKRIAAPGEQLRMGSGHEVYSKTFPLLQELDVNLGSGSAKNYSYLSIRNNHVFPGEEAPPVSLAFKGIKTVSIDQNGAEAITITDENGNVLATATSNPHYNTEGVADNGISVHLTATIDNSNLAWLDFHVPDNGDIGNTSGTIDVNFTGGGIGNYTLYNLKADNHKKPIATSSIESQSLNPSFYRLAGDGHTVSYSAKYYNWTYNYYDIRGRLVVSISPNGVKALQEGTAYADIDKTTYQYNHQGWLLSMTEPDAGTTRYIYRKDGSIRFSQNAKQELSGAFSYTKYDAIGRPIESGEYNGGTTFEDPLLLGYLEDKGYDAFPIVNTSQELTTFYGFPDNAEFNSAVTDEFGYCPKAQNYVRGAVSFTRNSHMKTWYSYDEFGQVEWMIQKPAGLDSYFHIEYEYDYFGNVTQVKHYRKNGSEELDAFYHQYIYDKQQRLKEVYAGPDGAVSNQNLQAKYYYYHHGPLERVELGPDVPNAPVARQGIDYVYTLQGWLKSINHPDAGKDPGKDGVPDLGHADFAEDLFAMTIEYFNGDYVRSGTGINSVQTSKEYFNGNISSIGWRTGNISSGATPVMYAYNYDNSYQLTGAAFGTPDYAAGTFTSLGNQYKVQNLAYDPNGNIQSLVRYGGKLDDGGDYKIGDNLFNYQYFTNKNKLDFIEGYANYDYNAIGQLTEEILEKAGYNGSDITRSISYDVTGKVTNVNFVGTDKQGAYNKNAEYIYDDRGFRLKKKHPDGKETWYIRDAGGNVLTTYERMSETDELEIKETMIYGSGRIGMYKHDFVKLDPDKGYISGDEYRNEYEAKDYELLPGASLTLTEGFVFDAGGSGSFQVSTVDASEILGGAQYELADHLGNVRVAIASERTSLTFSTNLETAEGRGFENITETRHQDAALNHTPGGSYSSWLNNVVNGQTLGPSISLMVSPGDTVRMSAYGLYQGETAGNTGVVNTLVAALAGSFTGASGLEAGEILNEFAQLPAALTGAGMEGTGTSPKAYLKYIVFDKNFKPFDSGNITTADTDSRLLTEAAYNAWEKLEMEAPITKNGYIYIYVANESVADVNVHFDDVAVTLIEGPVTSASDYYPFGLVMEGRSWSSEPYRFGYQGQFSEYDEETGWNAFEARMYSSEIGRWLTFDPSLQFYSPYMAMGNNPTNSIDPDGRFSRFGAWWRSALISNSFTFYDAEVGEYSIGWYTEVNFNGTSSALLNKIHEGGPGLSGLGNSFSDYGKDVLTPVTVDFLNPFVDVSTSLWTTTVNGFSQMYVEEVKNGSIWTDPSYTDWKSYTLGYDWKFHKNVNEFGINRNNNIESRPDRAVEVVSNASAVNLFVVSQPSLQLSNEPVKNWVLNTAVKTPVTTGIKIGINRGLETQK